MDTATVAGYIAFRVGAVTHEERLRLQKLLYYADGWSLAWTGTRLIDDDFEAWREGPVVRRLQRGTIKRVARLPESVQAIVDAVLKYYSSASAAEFSDATHAELPWKEARGDVAPGAPSAHVLSPGTMRRFFVERAVSGGGGPRRPRDLIEEADDEVVARVAARARVRWRGALDELADR